MAKLFIEALLKISGSEQQENRKRFADEFSISKEDDVVDPRKPKSYRKTFAGNIDDCFRIGLKISRKAVKLYSEFYSSDIIVASPLGLRLITGTKDERKDADFLSSIEVVIVDHADIILMQNWEHLENIFVHLNSQPKEFHETDFSRIRHWYLDQNSKYLRQTIICSAFSTPEINSLFTKNCNNVFGKVKIKPKYDAGSISLTVPKLQLIFERLECSSPSQVSELFFTNFTEKIFPSLLKNGSSVAHVCIVVPSYFDFVRVSKYVKKYSYDNPSISAGFISEYTSNSDISRNRTEFFHGRTNFLFISERYYFYKRHRLRGIKHLVFYSPPTLPLCYSDMINMLVDNNDENDINKLFFGTRCPLYYTKYDVLALERILGTEMAIKLIKSQSGQVVINN